MRGAAQAMKAKKLLGFLADQDGWYTGLPVMFLGQDSSAVTGPASFAKKFKAPVVPVFASRKENGHIVHILPALHYKDTGDVEKDMFRLTEETVKITEAFIREHPDEWLWFQHRWTQKFMKSQISNINYKCGRLSMKNNKKLLLTVVVGILILIGVGYFLYGGVDTTTTGPLGNSISFNGTELKEEKNGQLIWSVKAEKISVDQVTKVVTLENVTGAFS